MNTVYASQGGRRFHKDRQCPRFHAAHDLWRFDPMQWVPGMPQVMLHDGHSLAEMPIVTAFGQSKEPCAACFPELRAAIWRSNSEHDYGHEPFEYDGVPICTRCYTTAVRCSIDAFEVPRRATVRLPVLWPCTSAIVLGLAPRPAPAA